MPDETAADADTGTRNLRNLLAVAAALRRLALDSRPREATLYLSAAARLQRRAAQLAGLLPEDKEEETVPPPDRSGLHRAVDIHI